MTPFILGIPNSMMTSLGRNTRESSSVEKKRRRELFLLLVMCFEVRSWEGYDCMNGRVYDKDLVWKK